MAHGMQIAGLFYASPVTSRWYTWIIITGSPSNVELLLAWIIIYNHKYMEWQTCDRHKIHTTITRLMYDDERIVQQLCDSRTTFVWCHRTIVPIVHCVMPHKSCVQLSQHNHMACIRCQHRSNLLCDRKIILNMFHWEHFLWLMSCLHSLLGYSTGEFQALQLIVLAAFGAVD